MGYRDTGYLSFYLHGYRILRSIFSLLSEILNIWEIFCQFIRDICQLASRDILVQASKLYRFNIVHSHVFHAFVYVELYTEQIIYP